MAFSGLSSGMCAQFVIYLTIKILKKKLDFKLNFLSLFLFFCLCLGIRFPPPGSNRNRKKSQLIDL